EGAELEAGWEERTARGGDIRRAAAHRRVVNQQTVPVSVAHGDDAVLAVAGDAVERGPRVHDRRGRRDVAADRVLAGPSRRRPARFSSRSTALTGLVGGDRRLVFRALLERRRHQADVVGLERLHERLQHVRGNLRFVGGAPHQRDDRHRYYQRSLEHRRLRVRRDGRATVYPENAGNGFPEWSDLTRLSGFSQAASWQSAALLTGGAAAAS